MKTSTRVRCSLAAVLLCLLQGTGAAEAFPDRPVQIVVPVPPGGPSDVVARLLAKRLSERWGQAVIVDNKAGATGLIGAAAVAHAAPDGHTLLLGSNSSMVAPSLYDKPPVNTETELVPVVNLASMPLLLVTNPSLPVADVQQMVALIRQHPGQYSYSSSGSGGAANLSMELFKSTEGLNLLHVPYRGAAPALQAVMGNDVAFALDTVAQAGPLVASGKLHAIAITGDIRSPVLPGVPTFAESGYPAFNASLWLGLFAPAHTPQDIIAALNAQATEIMLSSDMQSHLATLGANFSRNSPGQYQDFVTGQLVQWRKIIRQIGAKLD